jgi:hypothetical protein
MPDGAQHSFVKCEAVKVSYRQSKDGMIIAFAIHPNQLPPELALAPVGTRVLLAVAEFNPEGPVEPEPPQSAPQKPVSEARRMAAKESYASKSDMEKAATRAALLCKDRNFQLWLGDGQPLPARWTPGDSEMWAASRLRGVLRVDSRSSIASDPEVYDRFMALETEYKRETGQLAEVRS